VSKHWRKRWGKVGALKLNLSNGSQVRRTRLSNQKPVQGLLLTFHCWATMLCCVLWTVTCYSISHRLICLYFIMYIVLPSHLFYIILYPPLSTLLPLMFVISCVCQLFKKECMIWWWWTALSWRYRMCRWLEYWHKVEVTDRSGWRRSWSLTAWTLFTGSTSPMSTEING